MPCEQDSAGAKKKEEKGRKERNAGRPFWKCRATILSLWRLFQVMCSMCEAKQGKRLQIIELFPKESREFIKVNLAVNAAKNEIDRITIHDKNGGTYTYLVTSFNINTTIEPFTFKISDYPNIEVIDLR